MTRHDYFFLAIILVLALGVNVAIDAWVHCDRQAEFGR